VTVALVSSVPVSSTRAWTDAQYTRRDAVLADLGIALRKHPRRRESSNLERPHVMLTPATRHGGI
jgi:hypothetical protein